MSQALRLKPVNPVNLFIFIVHCLLYYSPHSLPLKLNLSFLSVGHKIAFCLCDSLNLLLTLSQSYLLHFMFLLILFIFILIFISIHWLIRNFSLSLPPSPPSSLPSSLPFPASPLLPFLHPPFPSHSSLSFNLISIPYLHRRCSARRGCDECFCSKEESRESRISYECIC